MLKKYLREKLSQRSRRKLKNLFNDIKATGLGFNLDRLGRIYGTDKIDSHYYTPHYQHFFRPFKFRSINLLEIGVGGYDNPDAGGPSLRMWKKYFPFGRIWALDIYDKSALQENRIRIFKGSQVDEVFLEGMLKEVGELDIIIDDGSHINEHVIQTFKFLFPRLKDGGIYVIEDTQTSYWPDYGGSLDRQDEKNMMNFFKNLADGLNYREFLSPGYQPTYFDQKIVSIHFYHNLIFICKGDNLEESNLVVNNSHFNF